MNSCVPTITEMTVIIITILKMTKIQNDNYKNNENGSDIQYT